MKHTARLIHAGALAFAAMTLNGRAHAQAAPTISVTLDEHGTGTYSIDGGPPQTLFTGVGKDPNLGGLPNALFYGFSFPPVFPQPGDVLLEEPTGTISDVIRFAGTVTVFYSDNTDGVDALGDSGLPGVLDYLGNGVTIAEVGPEGDNGAFYTPTAAQPGYMPGNIVTYHFISDSTVPEPSAWMMALVGFGGIGWLARRKRRVDHLAIAG